MKPWMLLAFVIFLLSIVFIANAWPHMHDMHDPAHWYEQSCCSGKDCAPVKDDAVQYKSDGVYVDGFGVLSYQDPRLRWSRDHRNHICAVGSKLRCLYRRPNGT